MLVTRVEPVTKAKSRVYADEEPLCILYGRELSRYGIREGESLSEETYRELVETVLKKRARLRVMYLLRSMDRTEQQLRQKLKEGGFPAEVIDDAVAYVQRFRYQDDSRYAGDYVERQKGRKSRRQLAMELSKKGISGEVLAGALEACGSEQEQEAIRAWMRKKHFDPENAGREERQRMYAFLLRRGFCMSDVTAAVRMEEEW